MDLYHRSLTLVRSHIYFEHIKNPLKSFMEKRAIALKKDYPYSLQLYFFTLTIVTLSLDINIVINLLLNCFADSYRTRL